MTKEIIFRGKRIDNGEWVYGLLLEAPIREYREYGSNFYIVRGYAEHDEDGWHFLSYLVDEETIGQYTGLMTGENGKKIFEDDILNCITSDFDGSDKYVYNFKVTDITDFEQMGFLDFCNEIDIIGNIHDNPELLKEGVEE